MSMKKILAIILTAVCLFSLSSCESYLDVNKNVDAPDYVDGYLYLPGILSAMQGVYWDIRATGGLTQMLYHSSYGNYDNHFYSAASDNAGETWRYVYWLHGKNLENMINQSLEAENWTLAGIGLAIKAFDWDALTKLNGDAPFYQAYEIGRLSHDYDYQEVIYPAIDSMAQDALKYLEMDDQTNYGQNLKKGDLVYGGDKAKWIKFVHSVMVANYASLTCKNNFVSEYYPKLVQHAALAMADNGDNFEVTVAGGGSEALFSAYNNFWGVYRGNTDNACQGDYAVQIMTGTVPAYDHNSGDKIMADLAPDQEDYNPYYPYKLAEPQYICDTLKELGHFDPRVTLKLGTLDSKYYDRMDDIDFIMSWKYFGGTSSSATTPKNASSGQIANVWGTRSNAYASSGTYDGQGRWLFFNDAPYVIMTAAEIKFMLAEAHWKAGKKAEAFQVWKEAVALDVRGNADYMVTGGGANQTGTDADGNPVYSVGGKLPGGDHVTKAVYNKMAEAYIAGPYVEGLSIDDFTLSHIMMQKYVALYPWGASEVWVDLRKYHYDIPHSSEVPKMGDGWDDITSMNHKWDEDPTKVFKGFYLAPMRVQNKNSKFDYRNEGSPCYRLRPRYNSEYMWNKPALENLKPDSGNTEKYQCSIPWFAYPGDVNRN